MAATKEIRSDGGRGSCLSVHGCDIKSSSTQNMISNSSSPGIRQLLAGSMRPLEVW